MANLFLCPKLLEAFNPYLFLRSYITHLTHTHTHTHTHTNTHSHTHKHPLTHTHKFYTTPCGLKIQTLSHKRQHLYLHNMYFLQILLLLIILIVSRHYSANPSIFSSFRIAICYFKQLSTFYQALCCIKQTHFTFSRR